MKKHMLWHLTMSLIVLFCIFSMSTTAAAEEYSFESKDTGTVSAEESWNKLIESLPDNIRDEFHNVSPCDAVTMCNKLMEAAKGDYWQERIRSIAKDTAPAVLADVISVVSIVILASVVGCMLPKNSRLTEMYMLSVKLSMSVMLISNVMAEIDRMSAYLNSICSVMNLLLPVMEATALLSGRITEKAVEASALTLEITLLGNFNGYIMPVLITVLYSFAVVSNLSGDMGMSGVVTSVRKLINRTWQVMVILFSSLLSTQTLLAHGADDLAAKGAKFAIGTFIPIAGGLLSEAYTTLREGFSYIRELCGFGGILVLLLMTLPYLIQTMLYKLGIWLAKTTSEIMKCDALTPLLTEIVGIIDFMISIIISTELMFLFAVLLFAKSR